MMDLLPFVGFLGIRNPWILYPLGGACIIALILMRVLPWRAFKKRTAAKKVVAEAAIQRLIEDGRNAQLCTHCQGGGEIHKVAGWGRTRETKYLQCAHCHGRGYVVAKTNAKSPAGEPTSDPAPRVPLAPLPPEKIEGAPDDKPGGHLHFQPPEGKSNL